LRGCTQASRWSQAAGPACRSSGVPFDPLGPLDSLGPLDPLELKRDLKRVKPDPA
jgi:hypothetical protein